MTLRYRASESGAHAVGVIVQPLGEGLAMEQLQGEDRQAISARVEGVVELEDPADVEVGDPPGEQHLPPEALHRVRVGGELGEDGLHRHPGPEGGVLGLVDRAHSAAGDEAHDGEPTRHHRPDLEGRGVRPQAGGGLGQGSGGLERLFGVRRWKGTPTARPVALDRHPLAAGASSTGEAPPSRAAPGTPKRFADGGGGPQVRAPRRGTSSPGGSPGGASHPSRNGRGMLP